MNGVTVRAHNIANIRCIISWEILMCITMNKQSTTSKNQHQYHPQLWRTISDTTCQLSTLNNGPQGSKEQSDI